MDYLKVGLILGIFLVILGAGTMLPSLFEKRGLATLSEGASLVEYRAMGASSNYYGNQFDALEAIKAEDKVFAEIKTNEDYPEGTLEFEHASELNDNDEILSAQIEIKWQANWKPYERPPAVQEPESPPIVPVEGNVSVPIDQNVLPIDQNILQEDQNVLPSDQNALGGDQNIQLPSDLNVSQPPSDQNNEIPVEEAGQPPSDQNTSGQDQNAGLETKKELKLFFQEEEPKAKAQLYLWNGITYLPVAGCVFFSPYDYATTQCDIKDLVDSGKKARDLKAKIVLTNRVGETEMQIDSIAYNIAYIPSPPSATALATLQALDGNDWVNVPGCVEMQVPQRQREVKCNALGMLYSAEKARNPKFRLEITNQSGNATTYVDEIKLEIDYSYAQPDEPVKEKDKNNTETPPPINEKPEAKKGAFEVRIVSGSGELVNASIQFYDENGSLVSNPQKGISYKARLVFPSGNIASMEINDLNIDQNIVTLGIGDVNAENLYAPPGVEFTKAFAVNPEELDFNSATVTGTADSNELYKCRNWDYNAETCNGSWELIQSLSPGQEYSLEISRVDPGFAFGRPAGKARNLKVKKQKEQFKSYELPEFEFDLTDDKSKPADGNISAYLIYSQTDEVIPLPAEALKRSSKGKYSLSVNKRSFRAGLYKIVVEVNDNGSITRQEDWFKWGLIAVNTYRSTYGPGDKAQFEIAVLDNLSYGACGPNLNITMTVTEPGGSIFTYGNSSGQIIETPHCGVFTAEHTTTAEGTYLVSARAVDASNGIDNTIDTNFLVAGSYDFDIVRNALTKIDPARTNSVQINVTPKISLGQRGYAIVERVPKEFSIAGDGKNPAPQVQAAGDEKVLSWQVENPSESISVGYFYDVPQVMPWLYYIGPAEIQYNDANSEYFEARPWQIAVDSPSVFYAGGISQTRAGGTFDNNTSIGTFAWGNLANAGLIDGFRADVLFSASGSSNFFVVSNFGFNIPSDANIRGISAVFLRSATLNELSINQIIDNSVKIMRNAYIQGTSQAVTTIYPTTDTNKTYGSSTALWGLTNWTPSQINGSDFGVALSAKSKFWTDPGNWALIDYVEITVYYDTLPVTTSDANASWQTFDANVHLTCGNTVNGCHQTYYRLNGANDFNAPVPLFYIPYNNTGIRNWFPRTNAFISAAITIGKFPNGAAVDLNGDVWVDYNTVSKVGHINAVSNKNDFNVTVGSQPFGIAIDQNQNKWVTNYDGNTVSLIYSGMTTVDSTISVGLHPMGIAIDANQNVWVANSDSNTVSRINPATKNAEVNIVVGSMPVGIAVDQNQNVWVTKQQDSAVSKIIPFLNAVDANITTGNGPYGIACDANGSCWTANYDGNNVSKISTQTNAVLATITQPGNPRGIAIDQNHAVYVLNVSQSKMSRINPKSNLTDLNWSIGANSYAFGDFTGYALQNFVVKKGWKSESSDQNGWKPDSNGWKMYDSNILIDIDGNHLLQFYSIDINRNTEIAIDRNYVLVDKNPPTTTDDHNAGTQATDANVHLTCTDSASGCSLTQYRKYIQGQSASAWFNYDTNVLFNSDGNWRMDYNSKDSVGNIEATKSAWISISTAAVNTKPVVYNGATIKVDSALSGYLGFQNSQSGDDNHHIQFQTYDADSNYLGAKIAYSSSAGAFTNQIIDLNLSKAKESPNADYNCSGGYSGLDWRSIVTCFADWNISLASDGNYFIDVNVYDNGGLNDTNSSTNSFMTDKTTPTTTDDHNAGSQTTDANVHLTCNDGSGSGCSSTKYRKYVQGEAASQWFTYDTNVLFNVDSNWRLDYNSTDRAGNIETTKSAWIAINDLTFVISYPSSGCSDGNGRTGNGVACEYAYFKDTNLQGGDANQISPSGQTSDIAFFQYDNQSTATSHTWKMDLNATIDTTKLRNKVSTIKTGYEAECSGNASTGCIYVEGTSPVTIVTGITWSLANDKNGFVWADFIDAVPSDSNNRSLHSASSAT